MAVNRFLLLLLILDIKSLSGILVKFTNLKCVHLDPSFATFEKCYLKLVGRGVVGLNLYVKLYKIPVTNITVNAALFKKFSGYRPFLYNTTTDFCSFMRNNKKLSFFKLVYATTVHDTNINHTCPFNHDIIAENLILREDMFKYFPLMEGEYMVTLNVAAYNDWKANLEIYFNFNSNF